MDDEVLDAATGGNAPLSYSVSGLPPGLSFDSDSRTISGTPAALADGVTSVGFEVTYTVTDADDQSDSETFTITVNAPEPTENG